MNRALLNIPPWRIVVVTAGIVPLTVWAGVRWGETGGAVTLAALIVPVTCVALSGRLRWSAIAAAIAAAGMFAESWLGGGPDGGAGFRFAAVCSLSTFSVSAIVSTTIRLLREQVQRHRDELQASIEAEWCDLRPPEVSPQDSAVLGQLPPADSNDEESRINFPLLLLTLQDIGRRISMNLDLKTLVPAIISTAKSTLDCTQCEVYLWDRSNQELVNPLPRRSRDFGAYVPSATHGIGAWVMQERQILAKEDVEADPDLQFLTASESHIPAAVAPLLVGSDFLGVIVIDGVRGASSNFVRMLYTLASIYALGVKNAQLFRRVEEMALRDGLTGLYNHSTFQRKLRGLLREAMVDEVPVSLVMCDADHFKRINDTYGHQAGDEVLREFARICKAAMPDDSVLARYGGEEFIVALPGVDLVRAVELAEFLRESVADHPFTHEGRELSVTASFGVAEYVGADQTIDDVVREVDAALFTAKETGRNRVVAQSHQPILSLKKPS